MGSLHDPLLRADESDEESGLPDDFRVDHDGLLGPPVQRADGSVVFQAYVARAGILEYSRNGRKVRELVPDSVVSSGLDSLARCAVTLRHPPGSMVTPDNVKSVQVGDVGSAPVVHKSKTPKVAAEIVVRDAAALKAIKSGCKYTSSAYKITADFTPGVDPKYGAYDLIQTSRVYNHVALVPNPRGGEGMYIRTDGDDVNVELLKLLALFSSFERFDSDDDAIASIHKHVKSEREKFAAELAKEKLRADNAVNALAEREKLEAVRLDSLELERVKGIATKLGVETAGDAKSVKLAIAKTIIPDLRADADDSYISALVDAAQTYDPREAYRKAQKVQALARADSAANRIPRKSSTAKYADTLRAANSNLKGE